MQSDRVVSARLPQTAKFIKMAKNLPFRCLCLLICISTGLGSHFRGAIFMVRPSPGAVESEVYYIIHQVLTLL